MVGAAIRRLHPAEQRVKTITAPATSGKGLTVCPGETHGRTIRTWVIRGIKARPSSTGWGTERLASPAARPGTVLEMSVISNGVMSVVITIRTSAPQIRSSGRSIATAIRRFTSAGPQTAMSAGGSRCTRTEIVRLNHGRAPSLKRTEAIVPDPRVASRLWVNPVRQAVSVSAAGRSRRCYEAERIVT